MKQPKLSIMDRKKKRKELIADIERSFDEGVNRPDYARKLYLIENCIWRRYSAYCYSD